MDRFRSPKILVVLLLGFLLWTVPVQAVERTTPTGAIFIENVGQYEAPIRFLAYGADGLHYLTDDALWFTLWEPVQGEPVSKLPLFPKNWEEPPLRGVHLRLSFVGANPAPRLEPFRRQETTVSYLIGNDPGRWHTGVPVWGGVRYVDLYPGIDLELSGEGGSWRSRLVVQPDADLSAVRLRVKGAQDLVVTGDTLRLATAVGELTLLLFGAVMADGTPLTRTGIQAEIGDRLTTLPFASAAANFPFAAGGLPSSDLGYSTFVGGSQDEEEYGAAVDGQGNVYVTGEVRSLDFPTTPGAFDASLDGVSDAFVIKLNAEGSALDAFDRTFNGGGTDAFMIRLNPSGTMTDDLEYSTFLGGSDNDRGRSLLSPCATIAADGAGAVYVAGGTYSSDFPTPMVWWNPILTLQLGSESGQARFFVLDKNSHQSTEAQSADPDVPDFSDTAYAESFAGPLALNAGETYSTTWWVWVQPSVTATLEVQAGLDVGEPALSLGGRCQEVEIPQAQIYPVVFVHGILGSMPPGDRLLTDEETMEEYLDPFIGSYWPLVDNLQKMGYDWDRSLFMLTYDWRQSNDDSAAYLASQLSGVVIPRSGVVPYVIDDDKADLVVHSMGGLVSRAYVQGSGYNNDVRKVVFIASPHKGFPFDYCTWEGLTWSDYLYNAPLEGGGPFMLFLMNEKIWPTLIVKKYAPTYEEWVAEGCDPYAYDVDISACPKSTLYRWSHDPVRGIQSLPEMLPTEDVPVYLVNEDGNPPDRPPEWPWGHEVNTFLQDLNANIGLLESRLGVDNIYVIYGTGAEETDLKYEVEPPGYEQDPPSSMWTYGEVVRDSVVEDPEGDDLIPAYSASLLASGLLVIPDDNEQPLDAEPRDGARHKGIMYYDETQMLWVPHFLAGIDELPFKTEYSPPIAPVGGLLSVISSCPINLLVTDPQGRRLGYDPATGQVVREIPNAVYTAPGQEPQVILIADAPEGVYQITATGYGEGVYSFRVDHTDVAGVAPVALFAGQTVTGQVSSHTLDYAPSLIFYDDFERPDSTDLGPDWVEVKGDWDINDGQLHIRTDGRPQVVATSHTFTETHFVIETQVRGLGQGSRRSDGYGLFFGANARGRRGYGVVYEPSRRRLSLVRNHRRLDTVSIRLQPDAWYGLRVVRDGETGLIQVYLDQGDGYGEEPILEAGDATYPALGRMGWLVRSRGYDFYVDWIAVR